MNRPDFSNSANVVLKSDSSDAASGMVKMGS